MITLIKISAILCALASSFLIISCNFVFGGAFMVGFWVIVVKFEKHF